MILISFGTRPEFIKVKPLIETIDGRLPYKLLFTGQHIDLLSKIKFKKNLIRLSVEEGSNRLDSIVSSMMNKEDIFENISAVLVQGDTTSAFAIALAAFHRKIKIIHLEAGLRTYDKNQPYPEEFNRQAISRMADIHLCPTNTSKNFLINEKVQGIKEVVGNTVLDNLVDIRTEYSNKIIVTMHRRENHHNMKEWFTTIDNIASLNPGLKFIIPLHPNPNVQKHKRLLKDVRVIEPLEYEQFIDLLSTAKFVITDSGGLQEETSFLAKKCIVCREKTERTEGLGTFAFMCPKPRDLMKVFQEVNRNHIPVGVCPYGDGTASKKIYNIIKEETYAI